MSLATSPMRRTFSSRSSALKPRLQLSPWRTLSPSSSVVRMPRAASACSSVHATVDLPEPLRPVNHSTQPRWFSRRSLTSRDTAPSCQVMLSQRRSTPAVATPARCTRAAPRPAAAGGSSCGCAIIAGRAQGAGRSRPDRRAMRTPGSRDTCAARRAARQLTRGSPPSRGRLGRRANPYSKVHRDSRRIVGASSTRQSGSMALQRAEAARRAPGRGSTGAGLSSGRAPFVRRSARTCQCSASQPPRFAKGPPPCCTNQALAGQQRGAPGAAGGGGRAARADAHSRLLPNRGVFARRHAHVSTQTRGRASLACGDLHWTGHSRPRRPLGPEASSDLAVERRVRCLGTRERMIDSVCIRGARSDGPGAHVRHGPGCGRARRLRRCVRQLRRQLLDPPRGAGGGRRAHGAGGGGGPAVPRPDARPAAAGPGRRRVLGPGARTPRAAPAQAVGRRADGAARAQVYEPGRGLAFHFDKDEQLFRERREMAHPLLSTILYLVGDTGAARLGARRARRRPGAAPLAPRPPRSRPVAGAAGPTVVVAQHLDSGLGAPQPEVPSCRSAPVGLRRPGRARLAPAPAARTQC